MLTKLLAILLIQNVQTTKKNQSCKINKQRKKLKNIFLIYAKRLNKNGILSKEIVSHKKRVRTRVLNQINQKTRKKPL